MRKPTHALTTTTCPSTVEGFRQSHFPLLRDRLHSITPHRCQAIAHASDNQGVHIVPSSVVHTVPLTSLPPFLLVQARRHFASILFMHRHTVRRTWISEVAVFANCFKQYRRLFSSSSSVVMFVAPWPCSRSFATVVQACASHGGLVDISSSQRGQSCTRAAYLSPYAPGRSTARAAARPASPAEEFGPTS